MLKAKDGSGPGFPWQQDHWLTDWDVSERYPVYTRANAGEVLPDPSSPLNVTLAWNKGINLGWREGNVNLLGTHRADEMDEVWTETIGNFGGYHYTNFSSVELIGARLPGLTVPVWNRLWVGDHPDLPDYVEKPGDIDPSLTHGLAAKTAWALVTETFPEVDESKRRGDAARRDRPDLSTLSDSELVARARSFQPDLIYIYAAHVLGTVLASVGPSAAAGYLALIGEEGASAQLMSGLGGVDSAAPSFALWDLSRIARSARAVTAAFDAGVSTVLSTLRVSDDPEAVRFLKDFDEFLFEYGSRAPNEWDLRSDSWETKPELALVAVDAMRASGEQSSPYVTHARNRAAREQLTRELADRMPDEASRAGLLAAAASIVRFIPWRERTKTACVKAMQEMRMAVFELGRRMVLRGVLADHRDITMILDEELDAFVADPFAFEEEVGRRLVGYQALFDLEPPFFLRENLPLSRWPRRTSRRPAQALPGDVLRGVGGAPGTARGRARILQDPFDVGDLAPGDVLVAPQTDPAWTPLFVGLAAVVVNVGAPITHAAIISRELGIPCAVSVRDATMLIPEGALVEVDGFTGTVTLL